MIMFYLQHFIYDEEKQDYKVLRIYGVPGLPPHDQARKRFRCSPTRVLNASTEAVCSAVGTNASS